MNPDLELGLPRLKLCLSLTVFEVDPAKGHNIPAVYCRHCAHRGVTQTLPRNLRSVSHRINNYLAKLTEKSSTNNSPRR
jgi:hypothetical protein